MQKVGLIERGFGVIVSLPAGFLLGFILAFVEGLSLKPPVTILEQYIFAASIVAMAILGAIYPRKFYLTSWF